MAKVTSKLQVTIPKALAERHAIKPGDEIEWSSAGEAIRMTRSGRTTKPASIAGRLKSFDEATMRQKRRQKGLAKATGDRGWKREDLYKHRGRSD